MTLVFEKIRESEWKDLAGLMHLSVPAELVEAGKPLKLEVRPEKDVELRAFYMLFYERTPVVRAVADIREIDGMPLVPGCASVSESPFEFAYASYRDDLDPGALLYLGPREVPWGMEPRPDVRRIAWKSEPVPAAALSGAARVAFAWSCAMNGAGSEHARKVKEPLRFVLTAGKGESAPRIPFEAAAPGPSVRWSEGDLVLGYDVVRENEWDDSAGFMWLSVPAAMLKAGEPLELVIRKQ